MVTAWKELVFQHTLVQQEHLWPRGNAKPFAINAIGTLLLVESSSQLYSQWQNRYDAAITVYPKPSQISQPVPRSQQRVDACERCGGENEGCFRFCASRMGT
jgi:hypothetical protein